MLTGLYMLTGSSLMASDTKTCTCREPEKAEIVAGCVIIGGMVVLGGIAIVVATPYVIAAAPAAKVAVAAKGAAAYVAKMTVVGKVSVGLTVAQYARLYVVQTTEEKLNARVKEKSSRRTKTKTEFIDCLKKNRRNYPRNKLGIPIACEETALFYGINSSVSELSKKTEAFKSGKCFCD